MFRRGFIHESTWLYIKEGSILRDIFDLLPIIFFLQALAPPLPIVCTHRLVLKGLYKRVNGGLIFLAKLIAMLSNGLAHVFDELAETTLPKTLGQKRQKKDCKPSLGLSGNFRLREINALMHVM